MTRKKQVKKQIQTTRNNDAVNHHNGSQGKQVVTQSAFQGPIPPPSILNEYNIIVPDAAERIIQMAEKDQKHVHEMEKAALEGQKSVESRGQNYAITAVGMALGVVAYMSYLEHPKEAAALGTAVIVGLAIAFVSGKK